MMKENSTAPGENERDKKRVSAQDEERRKLGLLCLLLLLMLGLLAFTVVRTIQEVRNLQRQSEAFKARDVSTVRTWMTVPVVSHIYQVPESYLYLKLNIKNPEAQRHSTLNKIASTTHQPVDQVVKTLQHAIVQYRQEHPSLLPSPLLLYTASQPLVLPVEKRVA